MIIPNKHANVSYEQAQESVEQWWRDAQLADGQKNDPAEKLFPVGTQVPTSGRSQVEQVLHAKVLELEAERDRMREELGRVHPPEPWARSSDGPSRYCG